MSRTIVGPLLCVGSHVYDVEPLLPVAREVAGRTGTQPVFLSVGSPDAVAQVRDRVTEEGYTTIEHRLVPDDDPTLRNPFRRAAAYRQDAEALADDLLRTVQPAGVLASVNASPNVLLRTSAGRGIPTVLLQLFQWGDRAFYRDMFEAERVAYEATRPRRGRLRRRLKNRIRCSYGLGPYVVWDVPGATLAVEGPALRRQLIREGMAADKVVATGHPGLDRLFHLRESADAARSSTRASLGVPDDVPLIVQTRSLDGRFLALEQDAMWTAQGQILRALHEAAPRAAIVVKVHPRAPGDERVRLEAMDPDIVVIGNETDTDSLVLASDLLVSTASTTLLHGVLLDRPTVSAWFWPGLEYLRRVTDFPGVERVMTPDALSDTVRRYLEDPDHARRWQDTRRRFVEEQFLFDGHGTDRVVELVGSLIGQADRSAGATP